ncbi:hypothetical protein ACFE04_011238 [Oxalis oulophora]
MWISGWTPRMDLAKTKAENKVVVAQKDKELDEAKAEVESFKKSTTDCEAEAPKKDQDLVDARVEIEKLEMALAEAVPSVEVVKGKKEVGFLKRRQNGLLQDLKTACLD